MGWCKVRSTCGFYVSNYSASFSSLKENLSKETCWEESEQPHQVVVLVPSRSIASHFNLPQTICCTYHQTRLHFYSQALSKHFSLVTFHHFPGLNADNGSSFAALLLEKLLFFNIPTWHLTGLQDVESLSWASTGGAKKKRFFIFVFLFLEDVAEPVICTVEGPALVLTHGVIFWWMSPCVRHTGPILYFCDFSRRDTLPFALLAFLCFQFSFWTV